MKLYDALIKEKEIQPDEHHAEHKHVVPPPRPRKRHRWKKLFYMFMSIVVVGGVYYLGILYVLATVTLTVRKTPFTLSKANLTVPHELYAANQPLHFQAMVLRGEVSREVVGDKIVESFVKASGRVVFFNEFSTKPVTIKKGTVLIAAANKKRYVLTEAVTVPGYKTAEGKRIPGTTASIPITAEAVGSTFNVEGTDFTISGATGDRKTKLYARSSGAITGGESGAVHAVSDGARGSVVDILEQLLHEKLKRQARAQIPKGFVTYPELQFFTADTAQIQFQNPSIKFPATLSGTLVLYLVPEEALAEAVAKKATEANVGGRNSIVYRVPDLNALTFDLGSVLPINPADVPKEITITVSGEGTLFARVDTEQLATSLVGKPARQFDAILSGEAGIEEATYTKVPFWSPYFPSDIRRITIVTR